MLNFNSLLIFSEDPKKLVEFYKKILQMEHGWSGGEFTGFKVGSGFLTIGPHSKIKGKNMNPERVIFNLETDDVKGEFERIKNLGATVVQPPYQPEEDMEMWIATFADPDGNYFQLATPMKM